MPDKSGLPSAVFGAGAARLGVPSGSRGIPGDLKLNHWALTGADTAIASAMAAKRLRRVFIVSLRWLPRARLYTVPFRWRSGSYENPFGCSARTRARRDRWITGR